MDVLLPTHAGSITQVTQAQPIRPPGRPFPADGDANERPTFQYTGPADLRRLFGQANEFKEGDATQGLAAASDAERTAARLQISLLRLRDCVPERFGAAVGAVADEQIRYVEQFVDRAMFERIADWTLGDLRVFLLESPESQIREIMPGLRSEAIAGVAKLMTNEELTQVAAKVYNPAAPGATLGARGHFSSRVQPNSATDDPEEVLFSVLEGLSYGCGDALFGINIVASDLPNVASLEATLHDVVETLGLHDSTRHCVLAHIEEQMQVRAHAHLSHMAEARASTSEADTRARHLSATEPGSALVRVVFQSLGGTIGTNRVFGLSIGSLRNHLITGNYRPQSQYFETGQGSAVTNGVADGMDTVLCEARAHGLARALKLESGSWTIVNTVAGFIGPEVFKTRDQLLRACLEDLFMGKLHGLTMGLDICSTYHMGVTLDEIEWIQAQVLRAGPAFYMAVAGRNDPMLSYITTGFRDHPRLRHTHGVRVTEEMRRFYRELGVMRDDGEMTELAGNTAWVYLHYRLRRGDKRSEAEILDEGRAILSKLQARGLDLGYGHDGEFNPPAAIREKLYRGYSQATQAVRAQLDVDDLERRIVEVDAASSPLGPEIAATLPPLQIVRVRSPAADRDEYLSRPARGEILDDASRLAVAATRANAFAAPPPPLFQAADIPIDVLIITSDGLNARAAQTPGHADALVAHLRHESAATHRMRVLPPVFLATNARVRLGYAIGSELFAHRVGDGNPAASPIAGSSDAATPSAGSPAPIAAVFHVIGERPGNGHDSLSVYITVASRSRWAAGVDHCNTRVVANIAPSALKPEEAAQECIRFALAEAKLATNT